MATVVQAVRMALHVGESQLGVTDIFGQDVGPPLGGVFTATQGLKTAWNTPLDERGIVGAAIGLAMAGQKRSTCSSWPATPTGRARATGTCRSR
jgi:2-oxoisovalerate dehydrogenase E1 component beta subunit